MPDGQQPLLTISTIATMLAIHPQTLRMYERHGLIKPSRSRGNTRLYSQQDVDQIRSILHLTRVLGVNLAGVEIVLHVQQTLVKIEQEIDELRQFLAVSSSQHADDNRPQRALVRAASRKLVKVP
jgi:MerR family transcriptional regulator/heat shock protein HspR